MIEFNPEFQIGDSVYHATSDSDRGIILDITYSLRSGQVRYIVTFGRRSEDEISCLGIELSFDKTF